MGIIVKKYVIAPKHCFNIVEKSGVLKISRSTNCEEFPHKNGKSYLMAADMAEDEDMSLYDAQKDIMIDISGADLGDTCSLKRFIMGYYYIEKIIFPPEMVMDKYKSMSTFRDKWNAFCELTEVAKEEQNK